MLATLISAIVMLAFEQFLVVDRGGPADNDLVEYSICANSFACSTRLGATLSIILTAIILIEAAVQLAGRRRRSQLEGASANQSMTGCAS